MVEDERMTRVSLTGTLRKEGHEVIPCPDGHTALTALATEAFDLVITDLNLPGPDGLEILKQARSRHPAPQVIIMTAYASTETAVEALRMGARDYVTKPFQTAEILTRVGNIAQLLEIEQENRQLKARIAGDQKDVIIGNSPPMDQLRNTIDTIAPGEYNILIQGPSGTGKELVARAVHNHSNRSDGPFMAVNCSAIPDTLMESELFGYRKGAFTGADRDHEGYFARADGGSLFLDEVDDLPLAVQVKLLRVIQEREIEPVGGGGTQKVDFRLIAATKKDLKSLAESGDFREDLYYRLNVIPLVLPTLAQRKEDIPALVENFVAMHGKQGEFHLDEESYRAMMAYDWPGNVRELSNVVERMLAMPDIPVSQLVDGGGSTVADGRPAPTDPETLSVPRDLTVQPDGSLDYRKYMQECEERLLRWALDQADGNISNAAKTLGLPRSTLRSIIDRNQG